MQNKKLKSFDVSIKLHTFEILKKKDMDTIKKIGLEIREARIQKGLSITALSKLSDVSRVTIIKIERGDKSIMLNKLISVTDALKLKV